MNYYMLIIMFLSYLFFSLYHPLSLIILVVICNILTSLYMTQMMVNSWLSFVLILIYLGGLLIIFIYLASLVPNEMVMMTPNYWMPAIMFIFYQPIINQNENFFLKNFSFFGLTQYNSMAPFILIYLLMGLSITVCLTSMIKSPMKQEMN